MVYLAVVMDAFSRRIIGWAMAGHKQAELVVEALEMAIQTRTPPEGVIHHSDHGSQYTSYAFGHALQESGILPSMGRVKTCYDNAVAESFFKTLKADVIKGEVFKTRQELYSAVFEYIEGWYNPHRRHSTLGNISPQEYELRHAS